MNVRRGWNTQRSGHGFGLEGRDELRFTISFDMSVSELSEQDDPREAIRESIRTALDAEAANPLGLYGIIEALMNPWPAPNKGIGFVKFG